MPWIYERREDGRIAVSIDNNAWDYFFEHGIDLASELPNDQFVLFITREVEIEGYPLDRNASKAKLAAFIADTKAKAQIQTSLIFGFNDPNAVHQRYGGWDQGTWQSQTEREYYEAVRGPFLANRPTRPATTLTKNEADASVGARSFSSVVLTSEGSSKSGPIQYAAENGGKVLFLREIDPGMSLREAVIRCYHAP